MAIVDKQKDVDELVAATVWPEKTTRPGRFSGMAILAMVIAVVLLVGAGVWFVFGKTVIPSRVASALSEELGGQRSVRVGEGMLTDITFSSSTLHASGIEIFEADGAKLAHIPAARVALDGNPLFGTPVIRRIDMTGATLALAIAEDGTLSVRGISRGGGVDERRATPAPSAAVLLAPIAAARYLGLNLVLPKHWNDFLTSLAPDGSGKSRSIGLRRGQLLLDDARTQTLMIASDIDLDFAVAGDGTVSLQVNALSEAAMPWSLTTTLSGKPGESRAIEARLQSLPSNDLVTAFGATDRFSADFPLAATMRAQLSAEGAITDIGLQIAGSQMGQAPKPKPGVEQIQDFGLVANWAKDKNIIMVERMQFALDDVRVAVAGSVVVPPDSSAAIAFDIAAGQALTSRIVAGQTPTVVDRIRSRGHFDPVSRILVLDQAEVGSGQSGLLAVQGQIDFSAPHPGLRIGIASSAMPIMSFMTFWPSSVMPQARSWVRENMTGGFIERASLAVKRPASSEPYLFTKDDISADLALSDVRIRPQDGAHPPVLLNAVSLVADGIAASGTVSRGQIDSPGSRPLLLRDARFTVSDHRTPDGLMQVVMTLEGPVDAVAAVLNAEPLKGTLPPDLDVKQFQGQVSIQANIQTKLRDIGDPSAAIFNVDAEIRDFSQNQVIGKEKFENGTVKIKANQQEVVLRSEGRLLGAAATLDYRKTFRPAKSEYKAQISLDAAARSRLPMPSDVQARIAGLAVLRVSGSGENLSRRQIDVDLTTTTLTDFVPGWTKPSGQAARLRFAHVSRAEGGGRLEDVILEGKGVLVRGSIELDKENEPVSGTFPAFHMAEGDRASVKIDRVGQTLKVAVRGDIVDARGLVRQLTDPTPPQRTVTAGTDRPRFAEMEIDIKIGAIAGGGGEVLRQMELRMIRRGKEIRSILGSAKVGRGGNLKVLMQQQDGTPNIVVYSEDAGATLRFLNIYNAIYDGRLIFSGPPAADGGVRGGVLEIGDFTVRGDESLSRMLAQPETTAPVAPRGSQQRFEQSSFTRLKVDFSRAPGRINVNEALLWGPNIAATVEGSLDFSRDRVDLSGTYLPAYAVNNLLARIPIIGMVLGGGPTEGLVGINYSITGKASEPRLNINPLSAVTPGILRKMLDFRAASQNRNIGSDIAPVR